MATRAGEEAPVRDTGELTTWARALGALQEAERLGSWRVGSEHLLLACLLDPVVRRLVRDAGVDIGTRADARRRARARRRRRGQARGAAAHRRDRLGDPDPDPDGR